MLDLMADASVGLYEDRFDLLIDAFSCHPFWSDIFEYRFEVALEEFEEDEQAALDHVVASFWLEGFRYIEKNGRAQLLTQMVDPYVIASYCCLMDYTSNEEIDEDGDE